MQLMHTAVLLDLETKMKEVPLAYLCVEPNIDLSPLRRFHHAEPDVCKMLTTDHFIDMEMQADAKHERG